MLVLFPSPGWPFEMPQYVRGLAEVGATVVGVGDSPESQLDPRARRHLAAYLQVPSMLDEDDVLRRVVKWMPRRPDHVAGLWEPIAMLAARLREHWGVPGMRPDAVLGFRDKNIMKERIARAGIPVPANLRATSLDELFRAVEQLGYPVIVKPVAGAGSADTFRIDDAASLAQIAPRLRHVAELAVEPFITGQEYTYETLCIEGRPVYRSVSMYLPNTLIARQNEWISPIIATFKEPPPSLHGGIRLGDQVLTALGMGTGISHMEWFDGPGGQPVFGEIAARPPGANMVDLMNYAGDVDLFREWARAEVHGRVELPAQRPWNAAIVFKRAQGQGRIRKIVGLDAFMSRFHRYVARCELLPIGAPRRDWKATFLSDGNLVVRHPDWQSCLELAHIAARDIHLYAS